ncbi:EamA/RhaT family transporter, partial [Mesorhizobium sp. M2A.F.Ca.ET.040.01.1.1]
LLIGILTLLGWQAFAPLAGVPLVIVGQVASASAMFVFFFRLQAVGGPVYLSQIGYVAAAVGLFAGTILLGEHYQLLTWLGAAIITAGVFITTKAQSQNGAPASVRIEPASSRS